MAIYLSDIPGGTPGTSTQPVAETSPVQDMHIPTAPASLLPAFGLSANPWDAQEQDFQNQKNEFFQRSFDQLDQAALDPEKFYQGEDLSFSKDPATARMLATNDRFISLHSYGGDSPPYSASDLPRKLDRARLAQELFGGAGADSEEAFHGEIVKAAQGRQDVKALGDSLATEVSTAALFKTVGDHGGTTNPASFEKWKEAAKGKPGYDPQAEPDYFESWHAGMRAVQDSYADFKEPLSNVWNRFKLLPDDVGRAAREAYYQVPDDQRLRFLASLKTLAQKLPEEQQAGFWSNLKKQTGRDVKGYLSSAADGLGAFTAGSAAANAMDNPGIVAQAGMEREEKDFAADVTRVQQATFDPVKYLAADGSWSQVFEKAAYGAPGAVVTSASAAIPGVGLTAFYLSSQESIYQDYRQKFQDGGMDYQNAARIANNLAPVAAVPQVLAEKFQVEMVAGKLPFFEKALSAVNAKLASKAAQFATRAGVGAVEEGVLEQAQDYIPAAVQDLAHGLQADVPDVQWLNGKDGVLDGFWKDNVGMIATMLPLAIFGAGVGVVKDSRRVEAFSQATDTQLMALGVTPEAVSNIRLAEKQGFTQGAAAIDLAMEGRDPTSEAAKNAVATLQAQAIHEAQLTKEAEAAGVWPSIVRTPAGFTVLDGQTREEVGAAPDMAGALRIAKTHSTAMEDMTDDEIAYLGTMLEAGDTVAKGNSDSRQTTTEFNLGELRTPALAAAEDPAAMERYAKQVALKEVMEGGDGGMTRQILGDNRTTIGQGIRNTVNRLFQGAAVTDVFHEDFHGIRREAHAAGRITRDDEISLLRALDQVLGGKVVRKDGTQLRFIPEAMADADVTETHLDEAISEIAEMEILRSREGGTKRVGGNKARGPVKASPGMISRNLTALAKILAPQAVAKWSAFFGAIRARFGLVMSRALALKKAERDGLFDAAGYEGFLHKLLGTDAQAEHHADVGKMVGEMLGEETPFSLAPSSAAGILSGDAFSRIKNPVRRAQAMSRIARNFENLRLDLERLELTAGTKRMRKSLAKEAAVREAMRAQELENDAYSRHWQVFSNDELTKIKAQPVHAYLANPDSHLHGRLMSRSAAIQKHPDLFQIHRAGDYDGSEGVNRSNFGGNLMPDQAAQELFDHHLIKSPTPDALWDALLQEQRMVEQFKEAEQKAKDAIREARQQAKQETNDWLKTQTANQETNFSPKQESLRALASLDSILAVLPAEIRGRIGGYTAVARLGSEETRLEYLRAKLAVADKELESWLRTQFGKEFEELLKRARPTKDEAGQKPRGKIGATVHDLFRAIERAMGMSGAEVEAEALGLESLAASGDYTAEQNSHLTLEANLIRLAGDWHKADAARREAALTEATRVFESGYMADAIKRSKQRESRRQTGQALKSATKSDGAREARRAREKQDEGSKPGRAAKALFSLLSFEQVTQWVFGENTPEAMRFADWERAASNAKEDSVQAKVDALEQLFENLAGGKLAGEQLRWKLSQRDAITLDGQTFSELEAITASLMWRQEDGRRHMEGHQDENGHFNGAWHYDQDFMDRLEDALSPAAKAVRLHLGEEYAREYDRLNRVFQDLYGVSMPRHKHYSPLTVKPAQSAGGQTLDPVTGSVMSGPSLTPGSLRNRSQSAIAEPDFRDALQTYIAHVKQMEHWIAYAPFATEAMAVLNARELGNAIEASAGKESLATLRGWLDHFAQGGTRDASAHLALNGLLNRIMSRAASMALVGRVSVLAIQSTQLGAALAEMPATAYLSRLARLLSRNLNWSATMKSDYIQRRISQMPAVVQQAMEGLRSTRPTRLKHTVRLLGETISGADALFTAGTYAMIYDYQLGEAEKLGLTGPDAEAWARQSAERGTDRVAQPTRAGARSLYEVTSTHPLARLGWAFASEARQKLALSAYALAKRDKPAAARALAVTFLVGGVFTSILRAALRDVRDGGDDKEIFDPQNWDAKRLALAALTGPLQGIPALGDSLNGFVFGGFNEFTPGGNLLTSPATAGKAIHHLFTGHSDVESAVKDAESILTAAGLVSENAAEVSSLLHIARDVIGAGRNVVP